MKPYLKINYLNKDTVRIHANLCGDGNLYIKLEKRSPSSRKTGRTDKPFNRYIMEYTNTNQRLLDNFEKYVRRVVPKTYVYRGPIRIQIRNKLLYFMMKELGCGKSFDWFIPKQIIFNSKFRKLWLGSFFDDEGCISTGGIFYYSSNLDGINQVYNMLKSEGINCTITRRYMKNSLHPNYTLRIRSKSQYIFWKKIPFTHPEKRLKFKKMWKQKCVRWDLNPDKRLGRPLS